jgi:hypothetical protein
MGNDDWSFRNQRRELIKAGDHQVWFDSPGIKYDLGVAPDPRLTHAVCKPAVFAPMMSNGLLDTSQKSLPD